MSLFSPAQSTRKPGAHAAYPSAHPSAYPSVCLGWPRAEAHAYACEPNDRDFVALQAGLRPSGGLARGDDLALCLGHGQSGGHARLARMMVAGQVFSFAWLDTCWLPMFQFDPADLGPRPEPLAVLRELVEVLDGWSLAVWFVQPNQCLDSRSPLALLHSDLPAVLQAARLQRYVVKG